MNEIRIRSIDVIILTGENLSTRRKT